MKHVFVTALMCMLAALPGASGATESRTTFSSAAKRVALIELYTSEGCSSCPPADRWLSSLERQPGLWKEFIPIAFHVDYWDGLGWKDRFSRAEYSARQRRYRVEGGTRVVYTPGVFYDGREWLNWRNRLPDEGEGMNPGVLNVQVDSEFATVEFRADDPVSTEYTVHLALLGMNLSTRVRAGENRGRRLAHDFVVLEMTSKPLEQGQSGHEAQIRLPESEVDSDEKALAVWVSERGRQAPIQSTGGYLPDG